MCAWVRNWPVLEEWAKQTETLKSITTKEFKAVLDARKPGAARAVHHAMRSLFQGLKQERVIFRDPTRGVTLPGVVTLPASVPSDRLCFAEHRGVVLGVEHGERVGVQEREDGPQLGERLGSLVGLQPVRVEVGLWCRLVR